MRFFLPNNSSNNSISRWMASMMTVTASLLVCLCEAAAANNRNSIDLPFGDINVLVLTDVHSWLGGGGGGSIDYGEVVSFYERLHSHCQQHDMDLWFVMNGDWIDGTGLSMNGNIEYLTPLLEKMPWDALNVGNHELYKSEVVEQFMRPGGFVASWGDRYLSSNVMLNKQQSQQQPLGSLYRFLRGSNSTVLTFGFLYNMDDASPAVTVKTVQTVVEEPWFVDVVTNANSDPDGNFDAILVLAHMDVQDALVSVVLNKIRALVGDDIPVQFITGHTHYRGVHTMDGASVSFEAGRFLDTVGFVSFPKKSTLMKKKKTPSGNRRRRVQDGEEEEGEGETPALWPNVSDTTNSSSSSGGSASGATASTTSTPVTASPSATTTQLNITSSQPTTAPAPKTAELFHHRFIDADAVTLTTLLGVPKLATENGDRLSEFIYRTRSDLGLLDLVGCAPQSYYLNRSLDDPDSLWKVYLETVAPYQLLKIPPNSTNQRVFLGSSGGMRYDLIDRTLTVDDVIAVSPFNETIYSLGPAIPGSTIIKLVTHVLNAEPNLMMTVSALENFVMAPPKEDLKKHESYEIVAPSFAVPFIRKGLEQIKYNKTVQQADSGFTTTDIWLQFVKDKWECEKEDIHKHEAEHASGGGGGSDGNNHHHTGGSSSSTTTTGGHEKHAGGSKYQSADEDADKRRTLLATIALVCVVVLGTVYIWQLHKSWLVGYRERQRRILVADQENDDNELI